MTVSTLNHLIDYNNSSPCMHMLCALMHAWQMCKELPSLWLPESQPPLSCKLHGTFVVHLCVHSIKHI